MFASYNEYDFFTRFRDAGLIPKLKGRKPNRPGGREIINCVCAFDIETSRLDFPIPKGYQQNSHSFMYIWQFQIEEVTIIGRSWEEFLTMVSRIRDAVKQIQKNNGLSNPPRLIIWVHNLSYEFQWLQGIYPFENDEVFFRDVRKPIYCRMYDCIEFRCSFIQSNMSLKALTKQLGVEEKLSGQKFNYDIIRYPWTELNDYELEYCIRDVRSLVQCMKVRMARDGDSLQTIPYTSTGYVRRDCKQAIKPLYLDIRDILPDVRRYRLLRDAFRGGNTHANRAYVGKILDNIKSYDMSSCYPAQQLTKRFPMGVFRFLDEDRLKGPEGFERVCKFMGLGYAVVGVYLFKNIKLKNPYEPIPYISLARTKSYNFKLDNGRILCAEGCKMTLTEIDLEIILKQYSFESMEIVSCMVSKKDFLPDEYRNVIRKYFKLKTDLKTASDDEGVYLYHKSKEKLNAIYGMSCQDPIHSEILFDGGEYNRRNLYDFPDEAEKTLKNAPFPYQWGVYTTAYARKALQDAIDKAGKQIVYCDTDSVKCLGDIDLTDINADREKKAVKNRAYADDPAGIRHFMGVFEYEGMYDKFITQGAKRYAYEKLGKMGITVSGVSKAINEETGIPFAVEELQTLENFKEGMVWEKSAGTMSVYNDDDNFFYRVPGTDQDINIIPNIAILPTTYRMGYSKDYRDLLMGSELYFEYMEKRS